MTANIEKLIDSLGIPYQALVDTGFIHYKTPPTGCAGSAEITLDMIQEGILLSFARQTTCLLRVTLHILRPNINKWVFPNLLPLGLERRMSLATVRQRFGLPIKKNIPRILTNIVTDHDDSYVIDSESGPICMQIRYDKADWVESVTFVRAATQAW